jgi:hypothetical protein
MSASSRKRRWFDLALAIQLGWIVASAGLARAQPGVPADYVEVMEAAQREFSAAHFDAAVAEFSRADRVWSSARSQLGLGRSEFELRNYVRAIAHLKSALRSQVQPLDERTRPLAEGLLKLAERSVGRFTIESNSSEVSVSVDGGPVALPGDRKLMLNPGSRLLEVGAPDFESQQLQLIVKGGEDRKLSFALEPSTAWYANPWVWIGAGVLLAGVTTAVVVLATTDTEAGNTPTRGMFGR